VNPDSLVRYGTLAIGAFGGYGMFCWRMGSYACPGLALYGYRDDLALRKAMQRALKKRGRREGGFTAPKLNDVTWQKEYGV
jgi:hypothetical protein